MRVKKNSRLLNIVKGYRNITHRFVRLIINGDPEQVSHFDRKTPEIKTHLAKIYVIRCLMHIVRSAVREFKKTYSDMLRENRVLVPDDALFSGKYSIGAVYKNAWCLADRPCGEVVLEVDGDTDGILFYIGKQAICSDDDFLHVELVDGDVQERVLTRRLSAIEYKWELYHVHIPDKFKKIDKGTIIFRWSMARKGRNVCVSKPMQKRVNKKARTCVVIVLDGIRPDLIGACSFQNYHATPNIDNFFSDGLVFKNSYAQSNWTLPVFASIALSQYASEHDIVDPDAYPISMRRNVTTLAEIFRKNGFHTYGSVSHRRCNQSLGHHRGYDHFHYEQTFDSKHRKIMVEGHNSAYKQIRNLCDTVRNFDGVDLFAFVHLFDTHYPFLRSENQVNVCRNIPSESVEECIRKSFITKPSPEERSYMFDQSLLTLSRVDYHLSELFRILKDRENVTVILTSDHGFSLGKVEDNLAETEIRTPFMIYSNEFKLGGNTDNRYVESSVDILPTLFSLYGFDDLTDRSGTPLFDTNGEVIDKKYALSEIVYLNQYKIKLIADEKHYLTFAASRDRKKCNIKHEDLVVIYNGISNNEDVFSLFESHVKNCKLRADLKKSILKAIATIN